MKQKIIFICLFFLSKLSYTQSVDSLLLSYNEFQLKDFFSVYNSDVYTYFEPEYDYSTPLKKSNYETTIEYKKLSDSLKAIKKGLFKPSYITVNVNSDIEYDIKKGGIKVLMSSRFNRREVKGIFNVYEPNPSDDSKSYLYFSNITLIPEMVYPQLPDLAQREEYIFIPLSKEKGLSFENSSSAQLIIVFLPTTTFKTTKVDDIAYAYDTYDCKYLNVTAKKIILVADDQIIYTRNL